MNDRKTKDEYVFPNCYNIEEHRYFTRDFLETRTKITIGDLSSILSFHLTMYFIKLILILNTFEIWSEKNAKI
jgi:hypothetical protein